MLANYDFIHVALSSIETLYFGNRGATVTVTEDQIGAGAIRKVNGSAEDGDGLMHLLVRGDLSICRMSSSTIGKKATRSSSSEPTP